MTDTVTVWTMGDRLRKARQLAGLDTVQLGQLLDVARVTVSRWENGHNAPTRRDLMAYGQATGVRWQWLDTGDGEVFQTVERADQRQYGHLRLVRSAAA